MYYEQLKPKGETKLNPRGFNILILTNPIFSLFKKNVKCENIFQKVIIMINPSFQKNKREITLPYLSSENEMGSGAIWS
jgi:hypothetical protein